ncbi:PhnA domain-containing protein [Streptomyces sp. HUAS TT3]|uniref:PhnA domain-containing protein n=1 Tax=Streptomyces sp. HUAS TT3 TaxID=3447510 RepID=UPI003F6589E5
MSDIIVKDSNGTPLVDGDSGTLIKDLKVEGTSESPKRGTLVKKHPRYLPARRDRVQRQEGQGTRPQDPVPQEGLTARPHAGRMPDCP